MDLVDAQKARVLDRLVDTNFLSYFGKDLVVSAGRVQSVALISC